MKTLKTLSRRTLLFLIALPAVAITVFHGLGGAVCRR